jgi:thioredoxin-like negative regulator of GroEL
MTRHSTHVLWFLIASALLTPFIIAQESAKPKTALEVIGELFGASPSTNDEAAPSDTAPTGNPQTVKSETRIQTDFQSALRQAQLDNRPLLVVFGAEWCSWCRKLEAELETPKARPILDDWIVVKLDTDDEPEIASQMEVSALPALRILGPSQTVVASREGYLDLPALDAWLAENRASADPTAHKVLYETTPPDDDATEQLIKMLAEPVPLLRTAALERLASHPSRTAGQMVQTLKTGRLSQQLAACEALRRWQAPLGSIDPWQPETLRDEQFTALIEWSRTRLDEDAPNTNANELPALDAQAANELLQRFVDAEPDARSSVLVELLAMGISIAAEVRSRLDRADAIDDDARQSLRELLYNLLASRKLRLQQTGVIAALARLDSESHRQAAVTLLEKVEIVDRPLVDELARDVDPLVRELAVRAYGRLSLLTDDDVIGRLLGDANPNVRTAVLRVLTEHPSDESVESLCAYLRQETGEDLLVHGAKCLGQLPREPQALSALAQLAAQPSWRVRAAAVEAAGQVIQANPKSRSLSRSKKGAVPPELTAAIVAAAFEEDAFVAATARKLLPRLIESSAGDDDSLELIATALADHPGQFQSIVETSSNNTTFAFWWGRSQSAFTPLAKVAKRWLDDETPEQVRRATILLSRLSPTDLQDRVGNLIASDDRAIRLAGLHAAIQSIESYRATSIASEAANSKSRGLITPWYEVADNEPAPDEQTPAEGPPSEQLRETAAADKPVPQSAALEAVGGLFGDLPATVPETESPSDDTSREGETSEPVVDWMPSDWMSRWQNGDMHKRPNWIAACGAPTQALLASDDADVRTAALALRLVLGHTDHVDQLLSAVHEQAASDISLSRLLSWLPADRRFAECQRKFSELDDDSTKRVELLRHATATDDQPLADWVFEQLNDESLSDADLRSSLATVVIQSRVGGFAAEQLSTTLSADDYEYGKQPPYRVVRSNNLPEIPGRVQACDWLRQRFHSASSDRQRAIALMAVAQLDHQTAVDAAIGVVGETTKDGELLKVALEIMLRDAPVPSAQRATTLLDHSVTTVRIAALRHLTFPGSLAVAEGTALVPTLGDESTLPGFWRTTEELPVEEIRALASSDDALQQAQVDLLLLAAGEQFELSELVDIEIALVPLDDYAKLCIAAALAKAGRNDSIAIEHYTQTYLDSDPHPDLPTAPIGAALYEVLRDLPGDEVAKLRRRMRTEKGSRILSNPGFNIFRND